MILEVAQYLQVCLVLDEFLCATVKQANVGVTFLNRLSAELQDQAQYTVSSGMLGPKVDGQVRHTLFSRRVLVCRKCKKQYIAKVSEALDPQLLSVIKQLVPS